MRKKKGFLEKELSPFWTWFIFAGFSIGLYELSSKEIGFFFVLLIILYVLLEILEKVGGKK